MGYDMKRMDKDKWDYYKYIIRENKKKLKKLFYTKKRLVSDLYYENMNKKLNWHNPETFTEKLTTSKLNRKKMKLYAKYADKDEVRKYVSEKIGDKYLIKQYFAKNKITVEDLKKLPKSFALKTTNGSGTNYIVMDKAKEDLQAVCDYMNSLLEIEYGYIHGEFLYNYIEPKIVAELLLKDKKGNIPDDLKCFCFQDNDGNKRKILYIERVVGEERERIMFDENWDTVEYGCSFQKLDVKVERPKNYKKILEVIDKLSEDFNFVRVDLYIMDDKIYFGELTFIPTAGYLKFDDDKIDYLWGSYFGDNKN